VARLECGRVAVRPAEVAELDTIGPYRRVDPAVVEFGDSDGVGTGTGRTRKARTGSDGTGTGRTRMARTGSGP